MSEEHERNSDFELAPKPERSDQLPEDAPAEQVPDDEAQRQEDAER
ncbi:MAG: hypothetical protein NVSMB51_03760 [Solirubrobacteraceae bacterium]